MATVTIRNLPEELVARIKSAARRHGCSMEQEVRELLLTRYPHRAEAVAELVARWERLPETAAGEIDGWVEKGRR